MQSSRFARVSAALMGAFLLAGCAGLPRTNDARQYSYDTSMLNDIARRGGMPVVVPGEPFPGASGVFRKRAAEILTATHRGPVFPIYPEGTRPSEGNPWRTVILINPASAVTAANVCGGQLSGNAVDGGDISMVAALCNGTRAKTIVRGWASDVAGDPGSQQVGRLLRQTALALYPLIDEDRDRDSSGGDFAP